MMEIAKLYDAEIHEFYFKHSFFVDYRRSVFFLSSTGNTKLSHIVVGGGEMIV